MSAELFVGIDVAKTELQIGLFPGQHSWAIPHTEEAIEELVKTLQKKESTLVVMESTGGLELPLAAALQSAGLAVCIVNPRQVRYFARATGKLSKNDRIDSLVLAHYARTLRPTPRPLPSDQQQQLDALLLRRRQLIQMRTMESNRLGSCRQEVARQNLQEHLAWLEQQEEKLNELLAEQIRSSSAWRAQDRLVQTIPGVGPVTSAALLAELPELAS